MVMILSWGLIGLLFLILGVCKIIIFIKWKKYPSIIGSIEDYVLVSGCEGEDLKKPIVYYEVNGISYKKEIIGWFKKGKKVKLYYNPNDPNYIIRSSDNGIILTIIGIIITGIFIYTMLGISGIISMQ